MRDFLIKHQDRVLYATDIAIRSAENFDERLETVSRIHREDYRYFSTDELIDIDEREEAIRGLDLPESVLKKLFTDNAENWYDI